MRPAFIYSRTAPPYAPVKQKLARLIYPHGSRRRVLRGPARGMRFVVGDGIGVSYAVGVDAAAPRHFEGWVKRGMTVYDVGANKGQMALLFASLVGPDGRVVAFEPAPDVFARLRENLSLNGLDCVHPVQVAAADEEGELTFAYDPERPTQGKLLDVELTLRLDSADTITVPARPLDSVLDDEPPPDVVKLDVEGAAASALRGATRILDEVGPAIYIELHGPEEQAGVRDEVLSRGYVAETLDGTRVPDPTDGWHSPLWCHRPS